jgi:2-polyprenyl-3-methyl-5-hydroxy-6-metoxy-1,4-benzoquinol methylase
MTGAQGSEGFKRLEREGWSKPGKGAAYDRLFGPITRPFVGPLLDACTVRPGQHVLDIGTGPGFVAAEAARRGARVIGADFSPDMVETARRLNPGLEFRQASAESPGFPAESFDVVVANFVLQHVGDLERTLAALAKLLRPGGRIGFTNWTFPEGSLQWVFSSVAGQIAASEGVMLPPGPDLQLIENPARISDLLAAVGFKDAAVQALTRPFLLADEEQLWDVMTQAAVRSAAMIERMSESGIAAVRAGVRRRLEGFRTSEGYSVTLNAQLTTALKRDPTM